MKGKKFEMFRRKCKRIIYDLKEETNLFGKAKTNKQTFFWKLEGEVMFYLILYCA